MVPSTPQVFVAYAPPGNGLRYALAYLAEHRDVFGWCTGPGVSGGLVALNFVLEGFYSNQESRYATARGLDLHTDWLLDQRRCHELPALQEAFAGGRSIPAIRTRRSIRPVSSVACCGVSRSVGRPVLT